MNADHMIDATTPRINAAERAQRHARMERASGRRAPWTGRSGGQLAAEDPVLAGPTASGFEIYGDHADGDMPSAAAGTPRALREAGFGEARAVWCSPSDTLVLGPEVSP